MPDLCYKVFYIVHSTTGNTRKSGIIYCCTFIVEPSLKKKKTCGIGTVLHCVVPMVTALLLSTVPSLA